MSPIAETTLDQTSLLDDIEKRVNEIFSAQKNEVEQSLVERICREKEEAQRRIDAVNREFAEVRGFLEEHKTAMAELQSLEEHLRGEIRGHFERAVNYQKMMEHAAVLAGGELEKIGGLNDELGKLRAKADSIYDGLKSRLSGYAGIIAQIPAPAIKGEGEFDWTEEIGKLRKVRDLLATLRQPEIFDAGGDGNEALETASEPGPAAPAAETAEELAASLGLVGIEEDGVLDDAEFAQGDRGTPEGALAESEADEPAAAEAAPAAAHDEPAPEPAEEPAVPADGCQFAAPPANVNTAALEGLARYRRAEPVNNSIEIAFYVSGTGTFLDADSFMTAVGKILDAAGQLHSQLGQTTSVKDLFLLKQEILNQQEVLRKLFFRVVRFCDKEGGRLPASLDDIVGSRGLKDIIERLTMANWSDPSDFRPFQNELKSIERAFEARTGASGNYLQSVLDEVEGRQN